MKHVLVEDVDDFFNILRGYARSIEEVYWYTDYIDTTVNICFFKDAGTHKEMTYETQVPYDKMNLENDIARIVRRLKSNAQKIKKKTTRTIAVINGRFVKSSMS